MQGLDIAPSQSWGSVRLVPLLRRRAHDDLRLFKRSYGDDVMAVALDGKRPYEQPRTSYWSYVPHGLVASWSDDGSPVAAFGTQVERIGHKDGKQRKVGPVTVRIAHRMIRREAPNRLRFLPLHLAMEGFLSLHFGGPEIAWSEYAQETMSVGLGVRSEWSVSGRAISGLSDALRVFEIHDEQVGVLVFVADALASAFIVPHPDDYRALHRSLLADFYGRLIYQYGALYTGENRLFVAMDDRRVASMSDLRAQLSAMYAHWAEFLGFMAEGILERNVTTGSSYRFGPFVMHRFLTELNLTSENHLGEAIVRDDGSLAYLKTYRLSNAQTRRAYLLSQLAQHRWNLDATAAALGTSRDGLILRLTKAGFGYLLKKHVVDEARRRLKKGAHG